MGGSSRGWWVGCFIPCLLDHWACRRNRCPPHSSLSLPARCPYPSLTSRSCEALAICTAPSRNLHASHSPTNGFPPSAQLQNSSRLKNRTKIHPSYCYPFTSLIPIISFLTLLLSQPGDPWPSMTVIPCQLSRPSLFIKFF